MRHHSTVYPLIGIVIGMLMLAYASVPLYRMFCKVTGYGGTTQEALALPDTISERTVTVRFNTDTDFRLPWKFTGPKPVTVHIGENKLVAFHAVNESSQLTRGTATFNVVPYEAGRYFSKIQCFCFEEQRLAPNQQANFPVSFFIDPAILDDPQIRDISNITLSYTFFSYESRNKRP
jgi:cytochrome c oxidase assembly protein subunit 11